MARLTVSSSRMRALMNMDVTFNPPGESRVDRYPTPEQLAEALTAVGLQPPSLVARQRTPDEALPTSSESALFQKLANVATTVVEGQSQAEDDLLRWSTMASEGKPPPTFADLTVRT